MNATYLRWRFRGGGLDGLGRDGRAERVPVPTCGPDEILVRVDALGICASDAKMVRMGADYPLFQDRDFQRDPAQLGHEVALTVVAAGRNRRHAFPDGRRLGLQPDVFAGGVREIFGVNLPGGMAQFVILGDPVLGGVGPVDARAPSGGGGYVFDVPDDVGHADVALTEPWACVDASYRLARRVEPLSGGRAWIRVGPDARDDRRSSTPFPSGRAVLSGIGRGAAASWFANEARLVEAEGGTADDARRAAGGQPFTDIVLIDPESASVVEDAIGALAPGGTLALNLAHPLDRPVRLPLNRIHYEKLSFMGSADRDLGTAYGPVRNRSDAKPGGVLAILGAGGAMGRMHLQRALRSREVPRTILAVNRGAERLAAIERDFADLARERGVRLATWSEERDAVDLAQVVGEMSGGRGCDDIVVVAPSAELAERAARHLAPGGALNCFAGVRDDDIVGLPLDRVATDGLRIFGTSGSVRADQERILDKAVAGRLAPSSIVAAIGGIHAVRDAVGAVMDKAYDGKIVIYPQLEDLPLLDLAAVASRFPRVGRAMRGDAGSRPEWNRRAEALLLGEGP